MTRFWRSSCWCVWAGAALLATASSSSAQTAGGFRFPWSGDWEYRQGWHGPGDPALDIGIRGTTADKRILAAANGVVTGVCRGNLSANVTIDHGGVTLEYWHMEVSTLAPGIAVGQSVVQGQVLGIARSGSWTREADGSPGCGHADDQDADSAHLHWVLPTDAPFTADGWTIQPDSSVWARGSETRNPGCCPYALLPSTNAPSAPVTVQKAGDGGGTVTSNPVGIDCGADCSHGYRIGTPLTLIAVPDANSTFAGWTGGCTASTSACVMSVDGSKSATATFSRKPATFPLSVVLTGDGSGTVVGNGINCGSDCTENYSAGATVTLRASPASGSVFGGWSGVCTGTGDCVLTMNAAKSVTAGFSRISQPPGTFLMVVSRAGNGSGAVTSVQPGINCSLDCTEAYPAGTEVTLRAFADPPHSSFAGWSGVCAGTGDCVVTMSSNKSITATFNLENPVALPPVTLISPRGMVSTRTPEFRWTAQTFPALYNLQAWQAGNPRAGVINESRYSKDICSDQTSVCSHRPSNALANGSYVWRVLAHKLNDPGSTYSTSEEVLFSVAGAPCNYSLSHGSTAIGANGGGGSLVINAAAECSWTVTSNADWLWVSPGKGSGSGSITYGILPNCTPSARTASISIAGLEPISGQPVNITQARNNVFSVAQFSPNPTYNVHSGQWHSGDFNGDGRVDLIHLTESDYVHPWLSRGDGTYDVGMFRPLAGYNIRSGKWLTGDFNGDGRADLLHVTDADYVHPWLSNGDGTFNVRQFQHQPRYNNRSGSWLAGDVNGDGRTDLIHLPNATYIHPWISNGDGTFDVKQFAPWPGYGVSLGRWMAGDFSGDGRTDLIHLITDYAHPWLSNGDGTFSVGTFRPWAGYDMSTGRWLTGDFNGDKAIDLVHVSGSDYVRPWLSNRNGGFSVGFFSPGAGYATSQWEWLAGDLDNNGATDLVHIVGGEYVHPWLSRGNGTFSLSTFCPAPRYNSKSGRWITTDLNGDRKTDLVHLVQDNYVHPWVSGADESSYANVFSVPGGAPCPGCPIGPNITVWVNTASGVYHCSGNRFYGTTKAGSYMTQKQAQDIGYRPAYGRVCTR